MPFFSNLAGQHGATSGKIWKQSRYIARSRTGGRDVIMDAGSCAQFSAEWIVMEKRGLGQMFGLHMSHPDTYEHMRELRVAQHLGHRARSPERYLANWGLVQIGGTVTYVAANFLTIAQEATRYSGYYMVGISNYVNGMQLAAVNAHALAVKIGPECAIFDPNFGVARFQDADDLCGFLVDLLQQKYPAYVGGGTLTRFAL